MVQAKLEKLQADLEAAHAAGNRDVEANTLNNVGNVYSALGEKESFNMVTIIATVL
jgi:hypothetical protein